MKILFFLLPVLLILSSCHFIKGSGNIISEKRIIGNFTGISASDAFEVEFKIGPVTEVIVESDDNIMPYIVTKVSGDVLKISTKNRHSFSNAHLKVYITAPVIGSVDMSAAASFIAKDTMKYAGRLSFRASSAGSIIADVDAPEVENRASSGATIKLNGKTRYYFADASSGADLMTDELLSENTTVTTSSGASAHVHASVSLKATASSGANIIYHGAASLQKSVSSGGSVEKRN